MKDNKLNQYYFLFLITSALLGHPISLFADTTNHGPNIVLILVDDAALMDFGIYGGEAVTPNIDELAQQGLLFTNYHTSPMCAPSRAMLLTGCDSHLTGVPNLPEFLSPEHTVIPNYEGILNTRVKTVASLLKTNGYNTYMTGKWHLGNTNYTLPSKRGFDRTFALGASGADNYDDKGYIPFKGKAPWFADGKPTELPDDFYSSEFLVDKMMEFMDDNPDKENPFFAYLAFQAIHIPVQAPEEFVKKYKGIYADGWHKLRQQRYEKAKKLGLIPADAPLGDMLPVLKKWETLSEEEKTEAANDMAVNAAMLEAMDYHIGRYITYLKSKGWYDNTVFMITSDNGPEASVVRDNKAADVWMKWVGYHRDQNRLGGKGYYGFIGPEFASAAAGPSAFFKFYAGEGGLRCPLIMSGKNIPKGQKRSAFTMVTDITPTILEMAGIKNQPTTVPITGKNLLPIIQNDTAIAYQPNEPIGIEAAGQCALFKGDMKLVRNAKPYGDAIWRLYNLAVDPGETNDLSKSSPKIFAQMISDYVAYTQKNGVIEMGSMYEPQLELQNKIVKIVRDAIKPWLIGFVILLIGFFMLRRIKNNS